MQGGAGGGVGGNISGGEKDPWEVKYTIERNIELQYGDISFLKLTSIIIYVDL